MWSFAGVNSLSLETGNYLLDILQHFIWFYSYFLVNFWSFFCQLVYSFSLHCNDHNLSGYSNQIIWFVFRMIFMFWSFNKNIILNLLFFIIVLKCTKYISLGHIADKKFLTTEFLFKYLSWLQIKFDSNLNEEFGSSYLNKKISYIPLSYRIWSSSHVSSFFFSVGLFCFQFS